MAKTDLTVEFVRSLFHYDPETGYLWRHFKTCSCRVNTRSHGYIQVSVNRRLYMAHRVIWLWAHGEWPPGEVDHVNGTKTDNRLVNLRAVTRSVNQQNRRGASIDSRSGFLGVRKSQQNNLRKPWEARIRVNGKDKHLGGYATPEEAHEAYLQAKRLLHEGNTL